MGFLDKIKRQASDAARKHGDTISGGIDKTGEAVNKATKNKYSHHVAKAKDKAKDGIDRAGGTR